MIHRAIDAKPSRGPFDPNAGVALSYAPYQIVQQLARQALV